MKYYDLPRYIYIIIYIYTYGYLDKSSHRSETLVPSGQFFVQHVAEEGAFAKTQKSSPGSFIFLVSPKQALYCLWMSFLISSFYMMILQQFFSGLTKTVVLSWRNGAGVFTMRFTRIPLGYVCSLFIEKHWWDKNLVVELTPNGSAQM